MSSPPSRPPDWRRRTWVRVHRAWVTPMTSGAKQATATLFAVVLALFGADLLFTAHEVNAVAHATATVEQLCEAGNAQDAKQVVLWDHLVAISRPPPHETPAARRERQVTTRAFVGYVHAVFAPRDCSAPLTTRRQP